MPTPSMPLHLVKGHIKKADRDARTEAEKALVTGVEMHSWKETRNNTAAYKHYRRLSDLFTAIGKNDALIENVVNRYCMLLSESEAAEAEDQRLHGLADRLDDERGNMRFPDYIYAACRINKSIADNQKLLQTKRRMLFDIERENLMTLAAQMRSIPKKADKDAVADDGMDEFLRKWKPQNRPL